MAIFLAMLGILVRELAVLAVGTVASVTLATCAAGGRINKPTGVK
jgi:hypothetical protein